MEVTGDLKRSSREKVVKEKSRWSEVSYRNTMVMCAGSNWRDADKMTLVLLVRCYRSKRVVFLVTLKLNQFLAAWDVLTVVSLLRKPSLTLSRKLTKFPSH
jgi:hypothetical protein